MSDSTAPPGEPPATSSAVPSGEGSGWGRWSVLLPALTFVVGLVLGAVVVGVSAVDDDGVEGPVAQPSPSTSPSPLPFDGASPGALRVTVPAPCVQAAEKAETAYGVLDEAVDAVRELDARALADAVDVAQAERAETEQLVEQCRAAAGTQLLEPVPTAVAVTPSPTPTG